LTKELGDSDIIEIWRQGLEKSPNDLVGFAQYRMPSGMVRLVYSLKNKVDLSDYIDDPFFTYSKSILGDISKYTCKVLSLHLIPKAIEGSEVTVFVRHTHREVPIADIDAWMALYGTLLPESRF
jgi:hypothetical protein